MLIYHADRVTLEGMLARDDVDIALFPPGALHDFVYLPGYNGDPEKGMLVNKRLVRTIQGITIKTKP